MSNSDPSGLFVPAIPLLCAAIGGSGGVSAAGTAIVTTLGAIAILASSSGSNAHPNNPAKPDVQPNNFCEQLALAEAKAGAGIPIGGVMGDAPRLEAHYGPGPWVKMQHTHRCSDGRLLVIHYFSNGRGQNVELKFK